METERLIIQPTTLSDAPFLLELMNQPKWKANIGDRNLHTIADAENYIKEKMLPHFESHGFGNYIVRLKSNGTPIGNCGIYTRANLPDADIGYALITAYEGKGYALEAAQRMKRAALEDFKLSNLYGYTSKSNMASQNLLLKLGMQPFGTARFEGETEDLLRYRVAFTDE